MTSKIETLRSELESAERVRASLYAQINELKARIEVLEASGRTLQDLTPVESVKHWYATANTRKANG